MIRLYHKKIFSIDINKYQRPNLLKKICQMGEPEKYKCLVYDGDELIGAMTYENILYSDKMNWKVVTKSDRMFLEGRKYFYGKTSREGDCLPVIDDNGEYLFLMVFYENKLCYQDRWLKPINAFEDLSFLYDMTKQKEGELLDFTLLNRAEVYVFFELEEYSYEIARLLKRHHPDKQILFLDNHAELFIQTDGILDSILDVENYTQKIMYIDSSWKVSRTDGRLPWRLKSIYNSMEVLKSLVWCRKRHGNGETIYYIIDYDTANAGLTDIMRTTCSHIMLAKKRGWIPIVSLKRLPNQYLLTEQDNMWEYFFENTYPMDINMSDNKQCTFISALDNDTLFGGDKNNNVYLLEQDEILWEKMHTGIFKKNIKIKKELYLQMVSLLPKAFMSNQRVLGVIARGTDYKKEITMARGEKKRVISIEELITKIRRNMQIGNYQYIFVATEDEEYFKLLKQEFKEQMLSIDQERIVCQDKQLKPLAMLLQDFDKIELAKKYLASLHALSKCQGLLATVDCGAVFVVKSWHEGEWDVIDIAGNER